MGVGGQRRELSWGGPVVPVSKRSFSSKLIYHFSEKTRKILNFI